METTKIKNQLFKPRGPYPTEDKKVRLYYKSGNSTMLLCKNITSLYATSLCLFIRSFCKKHGSKLEGTFIQTR